MSEGWHQPRLLMWGRMRCLSPTGVCSGWPSPLCLCEAAQGRQLHLRIYIYLFLALFLDIKQPFSSAPHSLNRTTSIFLRQADCTCTTHNQKTWTILFNGELQLAKLELSEFLVDNFNCQISDSESRMHLSSPDIEIQDGSFHYQQLSKLNILFFLHFCLICISLNQS